MATPGDRVGVIFVHGFVSSPKAWAKFIALIENDPDLEFVKPLLFRYSTPRIQIHPLRTIPTYEAVADMLAGYVELEARDFRRLVIVTHSQGGLIVQRYLHQTLSEAQGLKLRRISRIVMFACPNAGSELALTLRRKGLFAWSPQEWQLRPMNEAVTAAHRTVINRVIHATEPGPSSCPIPITVYAGESDGVVSLVSSQSVFPDKRVLPGDHLSIIRPREMQDSSYLRLKDKLVAVRNSAEPVSPPVRAESGRGHSDVSSHAAKHRSLSTWYRYADIEPEELIHVDKVIDEVATTIDDPLSTAASSVAVWGGGGLGKTAITYAAVERVAAQGNFTHVVWASARNTRFSADNATEAAVNSIYWHDLLRIIAEQVDCQLSPTQSLWERELRDHVENRLGGARLLVVVDNLEFVTAADKVIEQLRALGLRRPHKIVATTRWRAARDDLDVRNIAISPLGERESYDLVRLMARGTDSDLSHARNDELTEIFAITEGNPFLIKLIARRYVMSGLALPRIVNEIKEASADLGRRVRNWLFEQSLDELALRTSRPEAIRLIFSFCANGRGGAMTYDELRKESVSPDDSRFDTLLESACRLGVVRASDRNRRYSIHSLLYEHTCPVARACEE